MNTRLLQLRAEGLYCPPGNFYIDPWRPVDYAVITHAHADHCRWGMKHYLAHIHSAPVMRYRISPDISLQTVEYGQPVLRNGVKISLHPAGHITGSAQVRVEHKGEVAVISGDYKTGPDDTCVPFEPIKCHTFITESTFGLPVYNWPSQESVFSGINEWWRQNQAAGKVSVIYGYSLGKAQRLIAGLDESIGTIYTHGAVENTNRVFRESGIHVKDTVQVRQEIDKKEYKGNIIVAPPSAGGSAWMKKFQPYSEASASGWMMLRGTRRRRNVDRGFVLSDHADWTGLLDAIKATEAENIYVTHGYTTIFSKYLAENGWNAHPLETEFSADGEEETETEAAA